MGVWGRAQKISLVWGILGGQFGRSKEGFTQSARRHDDAAVAVVEDDVGAVGLGEAWRGLEEFLGIHSLMWIYLEGGRRARFSVGWNYTNRLRIEEWDKIWF